MKSFNQFITESEESASSAAAKTADSRNASVRTGADTGQGRKAGTIYGTSSARSSSGGGSISFSMGGGKKKSSANKPVARKPTVTSANTVAKKSTVASKPTVTQSKPVAKRPALPAARSSAIVKEVYDKDTAGSS